MAMDPVTGALNIGSQLIDRFWPTPADRDAAKLELLRAHQAGELAVLDAQARTNLAQMEVNKAEAAGGAFASSWRPTAGYVAVAGFAYTVILQPLLPWLLRLLGVDAPPLPDLDTNELMTLLFGMLGLVGARSVEKIKRARR